MRTLLFLFCALLSMRGFSQSEIKEIKNQSGITTQYVLETDKIFSAGLKGGQMRFSFAHAVNDDKQYLTITIPESRYRRIYAQDSVQLFFEDGTVCASVVAKEQKGYMLKEKGEWLVYQFYLPFQIELNNALLNKLISNAISSVEFVCAGNAQSLEDDYKTIYYPVSASDKKQFQRYAAKRVVFSRRSINDKGKATIQSSAQQFQAFLKTNIR